MDQNVRSLVENLKVNDVQFSAPWLKFLDSFIKPDNILYNLFLLRIVDLLLSSNQLPLARKFIEQVDLNSLTDLEFLHYSLFLAAVGREADAIKDLKTKILLNSEIVFPAIEVMSYIYYKRDQFRNSVKSKYCLRP